MKKIILTCLSLASFSNVHGLWSFMEEVKRDDRAAPHYQQIIGDAENCPPILDIKRVQLQGNVGFKWTSSADTELFRNVLVKKPSSPASIKTQGGKPYLNFILEKVGEYGIQTGQPFTICVEGFKMLGRIDVDNIQELASSIEAFSSSMNTTTRVLLDSIGGVGRGEPSSPSARAPITTCTGISEEDGKYEFTLFNERQAPILRMFSFDIKQYGKTRDVGVASSSQ